MFQNISMTGTGLVVLLINLAFQALSHYGVHVNVLPDQVSAFVDAASQVVSFVLMIWGQLRRPDLVGGIIRRTDRDSVRRISR
jgi:hypothetical protein